MPDNQGNQLRWKVVNAEGETVQIRSDKARCEELAAHLGQGYQVLPTKEVPACELIPPELAELGKLTLV